MSTSLPPATDRDTHERWLSELSVIPTAAGKEHRVIAWIEEWLADRPDLALRTDGAGNMVIERVDSDEQRDPLCITAHLDHPAFVVEGFVGPQTVQLSFRGGVRDPYFNRAPIELITTDDRVVPAIVLEASKPDPFRQCLAEIRGDTTAEDAGLNVGDIGRWAMAEPEVIDGQFHTYACDDLAALAAALAMMDTLRPIPEASHVRLLLTRAEEVGFIGAIWAMKNATLPANARLILLENSRSFAESPIGGGPIIRVGDRLSSFSPTLTAGITRLAEEIATERESGAEPFRFQRKLMPGGACESTVFQAYGHESTCLCLPLGAYHNMANLSAVESEDEAAVAAARCDREHIALADYHGLIDLLIAISTRLADVPPMTERLEKLFEERRIVLD